MQDQNVEWVTMAAAAEMFGVSATKYLAWLPIRRYGRAGIEEIRE